MKPEYGLCTSKHFMKKFNEFWESEQTIFGLEMEDFNSEEITEIITYFTLLYKYLRIVDFLALTLFHFRLDLIIHYFIIYTFSTPIYNTLFEVVVFVIV